jgi:hypothetical protein
VGGGSASEGTVVHGAGGQAELRLAGCSAAARPGAGSARRFPQEYEFVVKSDQAREEYDGLVLIAPL